MYSTDKVSPGPFECETIGIQAVQGKRISRCQHNTSQLTLQIKAPLAENLQLFILTCHPLATYLGNRTSVPGNMQLRLFACDLHAECVVPLCHEPTGSRQAGL